MNYKETARSLLDKYKKYFDEAGPESTMSIIYDDQIEKYLRKGKLPPKNVMLKIFESKGLNSKEKKSVTNIKTDFKAEDVKSLNNSLKELRYDIQNLMKSLRKNIEVGLPSDDIKTNMILTPEQRSNFFTKKTNQNKLLRNYYIIFERLLRNLDSTGEDRFVVDLFKETFDEIDTIINKCKIKNYKYCDGGNIKVNNTTECVLYRRSEIDQYIAGNVNVSNEDPFTTKAIFAQVISRQQQLRNAEGLDVIIFINTCSKVGLEVIYNFVYYIDIELMKSQFEFRTSQNNLFHIKNSVNLNIENTSILSNDAFAHYFLDQCKDVYAHVIVALNSSDCSVGHTYIFNETYNNLFVS